MSIVGGTNAASSNTSGSSAAAGSASSNTGQTKSTSSSTTNKTGASATEKKHVGSVADLDLDTFLKLMLSELQNQDPLNPTDNNQLLQQISQIREISASDKLTKTLDSVLVGQNVSTATSLIGSQVEGLSDTNQKVVGSVQRVSIKDGEAVLDVAIEPSASAPKNAGSLAEGRYAYEVAWESDGTTFSVRVTADTANLGSDFSGSIRLDNLPETSVPKKVYRTDSSGSGELRLVGTLNSGKITGFTDTLSDAELGTEQLTGSRQVLQYASAAKVKLSNVSLVQSQ